MNLEDAAAGLPDGYLDVARKRVALLDSTLEALLEKISSIVGRQVFRSAITAPITSQESYRLRCRQANDDISTATVLLSLLELRGFSVIQKSRLVVADISEILRIVTDLPSEQRTKFCIAVAKTSSTSFKDGDRQAGEVVLVHCTQMPPPHEPGQYLRCGNDSWTVSTDDYQVYAASDRELFLHRAWLQVKDEHPDLLSYHNFLCGA